VELVGTDIANLKKTSDSSLAFLECPMSSHLVPRPCPVCAADTYTHLFTKGTLTVVRCNTCSMAFANPIEESFITGDFYDQLANPFYLSPDKLQSDYALVRFERELKLFRKYCASGSVLDVGCSTGAFLFQLKRRFANDYQTLGLDVSGPALDYAEQQGVPILKEPFLSVDFGARRFSAVTFWAVIEHLASPRDFLSKTASVLENGGLCFILVPNFRSLAVRILGAKYRYIFPQHVNYFTLQTLEKLLATQKDFTIVHRGSMHFNPLVIYRDWKNPRDFVPDEERAKLLKRTTAYKQNPLMKPLKLALKATEKTLGKLNLADNIVVVLKKLT
jgi:2-polyprenyl-3-methyl-5-hydroxy-6-metoxy-1,4-benzoquinol methylase